MKRAWMFVHALALCAIPVLHAAPPTVTAVHSDLSMQWLVPPQAVAGACDDDLFAVEDTSSGARRLCVRYSATTGELRVLSSTIIPDHGWLRIVRQPVPGDAAFILSSPPRLLRHDVATGVTSEMATFGAADADRRWHWFDREGDGVGDVVVQVLTGVQVHNSATGAVAASANGAPWTTFPLGIAAGQFDADPSGEIAVWNASGITLYDGLTLQPQGAPISTNLTYSGGLLQVMDWDTDGRDELVYETVDGVALADFDLATPVRSLETGGAGRPQKMRLVDWTPGGLPELAVVAHDRAAIVGLDSGLPVAFTTLALDLRPSPVAPPGFLRDSTGTPVLLWLSQRFMVAWGAGQAARATQTGVIRIPMVSASLSSASGDRDLLHGVSLQASASRTLDVVRRNADTLAGLAQASLDAEFAGAMVAVDVRAGAGRDVLTIRDDTLRLHTTSGATLWTQELPSTTGDRWALATGPVGHCTHPACRRILAEQQARTTESSGSRVVLLDGADGSIVWEGPRDNCLGCRYLAVALGDADGDGAPEMLTANWLGNSGTTVVLRDATTFAVRWQRTFPVFTGPIDADIAGIGGGEVALLTVDSSQGTRVQRIDPATGVTLVEVQVPSTVTRLQYLAYGANRGGWLLLGDNRAVWLLDADLQSAPERIEVAEIETASGTEFGVAYLASRHTIHRVAVEGERLLVDGFETAPP